jgi:sec-independent protein translocase protein TatC
MPEEEVRDKIKRAMDPNSDMSFVDHLEALRWHLIRSVIVIFIFTAIAFVYKEYLFDTIIFGPKRTDFWTYRKLCELAQRFDLGADLCIQKINFTIMNNTMAGQFNLHITGAFMAGFILGFPYILWELWRFIKPGLHVKERKNATGLIFYGSFLFMLGILFGYYIITPMSVNFLGSYVISEEIINQITLDSYLSTIAILTLATGLVFELPMVIYFLSKVGIMTPKFMRTNRRIALFLILLLAAFITPTPDIPTQMLVSLPLFILYEISIFVSARVEKKKKKEEAETYYY